MRCYMQPAIASRDWHCQSLHLTHFFDDLLDHLGLNDPGFDTAAVRTAARVVRQIKAKHDARISCMSTPTSCAAIRPGLSALTGSNIEPALLGHVLLHNLLLIVRHLLTLALFL